MTSGSFGQLVLWVVILGALAAAGISGAVVFLGDGGDVEPVERMVFWGALAIALVGLALQARIDLFDFTAGGVLIGLITALILGCVAALGEVRHPVAAAFAVAAGLGAILCVVYRIQLQRAPDPLQNRLRDAFPDDAIHEIAGVQFVAVCEAPTELRAGEAFTIRVAVQNCWDTERELSVELRQETRISLNKAGMVLPTGASIRLPGGAYGALILPVSSHPKASGSFSLVARARVKGTGGTRVRPWRGRSLGFEVPVWITVLGAFAGILVWGGGMKFGLKLKKNEHAHDAAPEPLPARAEILWAPPPQELLAATGVFA